MAQQGILIVLSGPSGAGKGTVCRELLGSLPGCQYSISATTRPPRIGETDAANYCFVTSDDFKEMIDKGELLEWAEVYGNYYGTPKKYVLEALHSGKDVVLEIDIQGAMQIKKQMPEGIFIYIVPPSFEELAKRIHGRGTDSEEVINKRLESVNLELGYVNNYSYLVVNDEVATAVKRITAIITAEKCKVERNKELRAALYNAKQKRVFL